MLGLESVKIFKELLSPFSAGVKALLHASPQENVNQDPEIQAKYHQALQVFSELTDTLNALLTVRGIGTFLVSTTRKNKLIEQIESNITTLTNETVSLRKNISDISHLFFIDVNAQTIELAKLIQEFAESIASKATEIANCIPMQDSLVSGDYLLTKISKNIKDKISERITEFEESRLRDWINRQELEKMALNETLAGIKDDFNRINETPQDKITIYTLIDAIKKVITGAEEIIVDIKKLSHPIPNYIPQEIKNENIKNLSKSLNSANALKNDADSLQKKLLEKEIELMGNNFQELNDKIKRLANEIQACENSLEKITIDYASESDKIRDTAVSNVENFAAENSNYHVSNENKLINKAYRLLMTRKKIEKNKEILNSISDFETKSQTEIEKENCNKALSNLEEVYHKKYEPHLEEKLKLENQRKVVIDQLQKSIEEENNKILNDLKTLQQEFYQYECGYNVAFQKIAEKMRESTTQDDQISLLIRIRKAFQANLNNKKFEDKINDQDKKLENLIIKMTNCTNSLGIEFPSITEHQNKIKNLKTVTLELRNLDKEYLHRDYEPFIREKLCLDEQIKQLEDYLNQRAETYKYRDKISAAAATFVSFFGCKYETEKKLRTSYVSTLKEKLDTGTEDEILKIIKVGKKAFTPRSNNINSTAYQKSLGFVLDNLLLHFGLWTNHIKIVSEPAREPEPVFLPN